MVIVMSNAVASAGGHWAHLQLISPAFEQCSVKYVTTDINTIANDKNITTVMDADLATKLKLIPLALKMLFLVIYYRPNIIISTGAAPGFFAILFGKLVRAKTIWVDSMANYSQLSVSGKYASKLCDLCLTQWPNLADDKHIKHVGSLL